MYITLVRQAAVWKLLVMHGDQKMFNVHLTFPEEKGQVTKKFITLIR